MDTNLREGHSDWGGATFIGPQFVIPAKAHGPDLELAPLFFVIPAQAGIHFF